MQDKTRITDKGKSPATSERKPLDLAKVAAKQQEKLTLDPQREFLLGGMDNKGQTSKRQKTSGEDSTRQHSNTQDTQRQERNKGVKDWHDNEKGFHDFQKAGKAYFGSFTKNQYKNK